MTRSHINMPLLKEQIKRFWVLGALPLLAYVLGGLIPMHSQSSWNVSSGTIATVNMLTLGNAIILGAMVLVPLCVAIFLYTYNFSPSATASFYTMPITKSQLFFTNFVAGALLIVVPLFIFSILLLIPVGFEPDYSIGEVMDGYEIIATHWSRVSLPGRFFDYWPEAGATVNTFGRVAKFFAIAVIGFMFYFALFLMAVAAAGNRVIAILLGGFFMAVPALVFLAHYAISSLYVFGFNAIEYHPMEVLLVTHPVFIRDILWEGGAHYNGMTIEVAPPSIIPYILGFMLAGVAMTAIALVCTHKRKHEYTGDSVVFAILKKALILILSIFGMAVTAWFMGNLVGSRIGYYLGGIAGFVLMYFIAQMVAEKTMYVVSKAKAIVYYGGITAIIYATILLVTSFGLGFFENNVPDMNQVAYVRLHRQWHHHNQKVPDPQVIAGVIDLHQRIVNNQSHYHRLNWERVMTDRFHSLVTFTYYLHNGNTITRSYTVSDSVMERVWEIQRYPGVLTTHIEFLRDTSDIISLNLGMRVPAPNGQWRDTAINPGQIEAFATAVIADYIRPEAHDHTGFTLENTWHLTVDARISGEGFSPHRGTSRITHEHLSFVLIEGGAVEAWLMANGLLD